MIDHRVVCSMSRSGNVWTMRRWRASSRRSRPSEQPAKCTETRDEAKADVFDYIDASTIRNETLDDRISEPYGVRTQGWISLSRCLRNRVQLSSSHSGRRTFITNAARKISTVGDPSGTSRCWAGHNEPSHHATVTSTPTRRRRFGS